MKIAVLGASGLLGSAIVELLLADDLTAGYVVGFDKSAPLRDDIKFIRGDITSIRDVSKAVEDVDAVINTVSVIDLNPRNNATLDAVNIQGAFNVLRACEQQGVAKLVHTSSMDVVFSGKPIANGNESLPYAERFLDHYSYTKKVAEEYILRTPSPVAKCALRATGIYGPNDHIRFPSLMTAALNGQYVMIGDTRTRYSHVYSHNCAHAHILAARKLDKDNVVDGSAYFIVDDSTENFHLFVRKVLHSAGFDVPVKRIPTLLAYAVAALAEKWVSMPWVAATTRPLITRLGVAALTQDLWFSGEKARRDLGYTPVVDLDTAIAQTAQWLRDTYSPSTENT